MLFMIRGKNFRITEKAKQHERSQVQILGEGTYADPQAQVLYTEQILSLCHKATFNAQYTIQELGKQIESYTRVTQGKREPFSDFLKRLTKAV